MPHQIFQSHIAKVGLAKRDHRIKKDTVARLSLDYLDPGYSTNGNWTILSNSNNKWVWLSETKRD